MKIGIISDTHDDVTSTNKAINIFEENKIEIVIHAGDIISPPIIKEFYRLTQNGVKFFGIFGNNDGEKHGLEDAFEFIDGKLLGDVGKIEVDGLNFCIYHGHDVKKKKKMIDSGKFDVFIYGHSHIKYPKEEEPAVINNTIVLNPGTAHSIAKTYSNPQWFAESSIIIFDTISKKFEFIEL